MLGTLAKYIFGGLISDAPETSATETQYHTREVNDWLLVDMPDQAIDDEDMNSESDEDEILTALPLLMAEEVTLHIVQSCEELKDHSTCDNSSAATAYIKEQIKELKPMQQAIQFENRKYMTRSQFNRQNRNYMYQSSVKTNRRKNLQRNPSGANNNRKC